ncbi:MAG TPA: serine hydrolase domain-containing protein [Phenylobacterium sp.]|jgi:CubicO group peptidase (beta-lactamase class C family)|nr:serine hydrolase domain-containing protein [Phenylobacterium sp.]
MKSHRSRGLEATGPTSWVAAAICALLLAANGPAAAATPPAGLAEALRQVTEKDGAAGVTAIVMKDGRQLYRLDVGSIAPGARLRIESASKWMTAALTMTVVDEGKLSLDDPIGRRLPEFKGAAGQITLRQLLSFTAGQGDLMGLADVRQPTDITLAQSAALIAERPLADPPGTVFRYGGPSLQVVGALVEQATGKPWAELFDERIARPLGMTQTTWGPAIRRPAPGPIRNPNLQGGVTTTADDYAAFLTMLAQGGVYEGHRVLSARSVATMETAQTIGKPLGYVPPGAAGKSLQYALGNWCETVTPDGHCGLASSPGMLGTYPWIDRTTGLYGLFFTNRRLPLVASDLRAARQIILRADAAGVSGPPRP